MTVLAPLRESTHHTYTQICRKVCKFYGIRDAEEWYRQTRKKISDSCAPDQYGIAAHATLAEFWNEKQLHTKWHVETQPYSLRGKCDMAEKSLHAVEIFSVRAPGANGEIGVLTTTHELDSYINGLANACAAFVTESRDKTRQQLEYELGWIFKNGIPIAFKLAGYKADQVVERHVLTCGSSTPHADDIIATS